MLAGGAGHEAGRFGGAAGRPQSIHETNGSGAASANGGRPAAASNGAAPENDSARRPYSSDEATMVTAGGPTPKK